MPLTYSKLYSNFHSIQNKNLIFWLNAPYVIHPHSKCSSCISFHLPLFSFAPVTLFFTLLNMLTQFCLTDCVPTVSFVQTIPALDLCAVFFSFCHSDFTYFLRLFLIGNFKSKQSFSVTLYQFNPLKTIIIIIHFCLLVNQFRYIFSTPPKNVNFIIA